MAQSESLGLLYLYRPQPAGEAATGWIQSREAFGLAIADQLGLAATNLKLRDTLRSQSIRDPLTGLFNRRYMEETLERELKRAERGSTALAVIMLDLDHFKTFNDSFGHEAGDLLLRELGPLLQRTIRQADVACRYGGEEFLLVLPDAPLSAASARAEEIRAEIKRLHVTFRGHAIGAISASMGIATFPEHGRSRQALIGAADAALYRAKNAGRDQVAIAQ
jgi:diguanylate cyclase (GGDEF)-like protein